MGTLAEAVRLTEDQVIGRGELPVPRAAKIQGPLLLVLAAGKGTRFGHAPKCVQTVGGKPVARHTIDAFRHSLAGPAICVVGYRHEEVRARIGAGVAFVLSQDPAGGTAFAAFAAFAVPGLCEDNPLLIIAMGDRVIPATTFIRLHEVHTGGEREAVLTLLTAEYRPAAPAGKGRILRDAAGRVVRIVEEREILAIADEPVREAMLAIREGNCPLYAIRAATLHRHLCGLTNDNTQGQYYLTDVVRTIAGEGGEIRTLTTAPEAPEYDLLCADVTRPDDLGRLERALAKIAPLPGDAFSPPAGRPTHREHERDACRHTERLAAVVAAARPPVQAVAIARQLASACAAGTVARPGIAAARPLGLGVAGGRLRIAFMHPDMVRFYGPAWQMPTGSGTAAGEQQILVLAQETDDGRIHVLALNPKYQPASGSLPADDSFFLPGPEIADPHAYEAFGTRLSEHVLGLLGYVSDAEIERRRERGEPLPSPARRVQGNLRHAFALVANALASLRTVRGAGPGARIQAVLGPGRQRGLLFVISGAVPEGGFSSSSALTVAALNALCSLFRLHVPGEQLVRLACQAEYGTGVRAGSLDQATIQNGRAGHGALLSSNPRDHFRVLDTYPVPTDRIQVLFPYSVERDRAAWQWSWGFYSERPGSGALTTGEIRKMTGKAAEIAAILSRLPIDTDYFQLVRHDLLAHGSLSRETRAKVAAVLLELPVRISHRGLRERLAADREWYAAQLMAIEGLSASAAGPRADETLASLLAGWHTPVLQRTDAHGQAVTEEGVPLRAMVAYLFAEVARNFYLIRHPEEWTESVTLSQRGDRCFDIDWQRLPARADMEKGLAWESGAAGPALLARWLERHGATPFDFNRGLDDDALRAGEPPDIRQVAGGSFFRGLALIDLAEAMLKRGFGAPAVAVRVNAAGQGDYFQVHVDRRHADPEDIKAFIRIAFYHRFGLAPEPEFVEVFPGGGALGLHIENADMLRRLAARLCGEPREGAPGSG